MFSSVKKGESGVVDDPRDRPAAVEEQRRSRSSRHQTGRVEEPSYEIEIGGVGRYCGQVIDGKMSGYGQLCDSDGHVVYKGEFAENEFSGHGILTNQYRVVEDLPEEQLHSLENLLGRWETYEGYFKNSAFDGVGKLVLGNNKFFFGEFKNGKIDGIGLLSTGPNKKTVGMWKIDRLVQKL